MEKLLLLCKCARIDIQTAVAFLSKRVKIPDQDDIKKLSQTLRYLQFTQHMPLTLEADELGEAKWWVDASFATHCDMRSRTGGSISLVKGAIFASSKIQKSSTEAELVGINDVCLKYNGHVIT